MIPVITHVPVFVCLSIREIAQFHHIMEQELAHAVNASAKTMDIVYANKSSSVHNPPFIDINTHINILSVREKCPHTLSSCLCVYLAVCLPVCVSTCLCV